MQEICRVTFWEMSELLCKQVGINDKHLALSVPLTTQVLKEEPSPVGAAKHAKNKGATENPNISSTKCYFVLIQPNSLTLTQQDFNYGMSFSRI